MHFYEVKLKISFDKGGGRGAQPSVFLRGKVTNAVVMKGAGRRGGRRGAEDEEAHNVNFYLVKLHIRSHNGHFYEVKLKVHLANVHFYIVKLKAGFKKGHFYEAKLQFLSSRGGSTSSEGKEEVEQKSVLLHRKI